MIAVDQKVPKMKVYLVFCLVASAFAYPQNPRYNFYPDIPEVQPKPCPTCQTNQVLLRQPGIFQTPDLPGFRYDRSINIEEVVPVLVDSLEPALVKAQPSQPDSQIPEETIPVLEKTYSNAVDPIEPINTACPTLEMPGADGLIAERVAMLREEGLKRGSRSPGNMVPILAMPSFDDTFSPVMTDFSPQDFSRHARSVESTARVRSAMPEMIPILTNIPAQNINNEMIESILRSARSLQSTDISNAAAPVVTEKPAFKEVSPVAEKAPQSFGMYYVRVKSYNYLDDELPAALKESSDTNKLGIKEKEELQNKYSEQDQEFVDFMQQLLIQQLTSLLEQQLIQQQDQLKKFLNESKTTPIAATTSAPETPVSKNFAETKVPGSSSTEKIEVTAAEPTVVQAKGKDLGAPSSKKA